MQNLKNYFCKKVFYIANYVNQDNQSVYCFYSMFPQEQSQILDRIGETTRLRLNESFRTIKYDLLWQSAGNGLISFISDEIIRIEKVFIKDNIYCW